MENQNVRETAIAPYAHILFKEFGRKAIAIAAQRHRTAEEKGEFDRADIWRRVRLALGEMRVEDEINP